MSLSALNRKLWRELSRLKAQIATIGIVLAGGVACFVSLRGNYDSLRDSVFDYYDESRFAHVFARVQSAPIALLDRIERLPGVERADARIEKNIQLPMPGMARPASAVLLSLPERRELAINALSIRSGRMPAPGQSSEVVVLQAFAEAHGLVLGQTIPAVLGGKLRQLRVVGTVLSPEFICAIRPGAMIDDPKRYTAIWMDAQEVAAAFELQRAFNSLVIRTSSGANEADLIDRLDRLLMPYGTTGASGRRDQPSHRILSDEFKQLETLSGMVPAVFLAVVAFLVNLVLGRFIALQRPEIAALKALGYTNTEIRMHYMGLVLVVLVPGLLLGAAFGVWLGTAVTGVYGSVYRLPNLRFHLSWQLVATSFLVSAAAAGSGAYLAIRAAMRLPPAEAMRPPAPARYRRSWLDRLGLSQFLSSSAMMVVRELERRPWRTLLSSAGIAGAIALSILGRFGWDSFMDYFDGTFQRAQRQDLTVSFAQPLSPDAVQAVRTLPGVTRAEALRSIPVRVRFGHQERTLPLIGLERDSTLRAIVDKHGNPTPLSDDGVIATSALAKIFGAEVGDRLDLQVHEGRHLNVRPLLTGFVDEAFGLQLYAPNALLSKLEKDSGAVSQILISVDPSAVLEVEQALKRSPNVLDVSDVRGDMQRALDMNASFMSIWTLVSVLLASGVVFGVVYNNARIALATRSRELASLRVLGFTRAEVGRVLLGSLGVEVLVAIPLGLWLGKYWASGLMADVDVEAYRWAVVVAPTTYAYSGAVALLAALASTIWIRGSLERLDLISVLKTRT
ncbi:MAG TPA: FtsX-like permease family protein [Polyangiaceae bacterium]|jgi:putative ABC transport system permease protein|nr:FtsX-like permease family protein [Polyangiaceae bacterium]